MLLVVDVGNTNTMFGVYDIREPAAGQLRSMIRTSTQPDRMPDEWYAILQPSFAADDIAPHRISAMVVSSVVPSVTRWLRVLGEHRFGLDPVVISGALDLGLPIDIDADEVGADRIVNAIAAVHRYGAPVIAIDFGTALNFDIVDARGHYVGGSLAPGMQMAFEALTARAAKLFSVELAPPPAAIGTDTTTALQSGLILGYVSLVEGMIRRISDELGERPPVVITGGYSELIWHQSSTIEHHVPNLTIEGLWLVYQRLMRSSTSGM